MRGTTLKLNTRLPFVNDKMLYSPDFLQYLNLSLSLSFSWWLRGNRKNSISYPRSNRAIFTKIGIKTWFRSKRLAFTWRRSPGSMGAITSTPHGSLVNDESRIIHKLDVTWNMQSVQILRLPSESRVHHQPTPNGKHNHGILADDVGLQRANCSHVNRVRRGKANRSIFSSFTR